MAVPETLESGAIAARSEPDYYVRFNISQRIEHIVLMVAFTMLVVTGLTQRFYSAGWAEWIILTLGGIENTRLIHRAFGLLFTVSVVYHLGYVACTLLTRRSKLAMLPGFKDIRDIVSSFRFPRSSPNSLVLIIGRNLNTGGCFMAAPS